jgi:hypothetical protein
MKEYFARNYRIFLSIILSLIVVFFIIPIFATPGRIKNLLSNIKFNPNSLVKFFTIKFDSKNDELVSRLDNRNNSFSLTPVPQMSPKIEPTVKAQITPALPGGTVRPTTYISPTRIPTNIPAPTKAPKPTKAPDVFPIDPSLVRPGKTTDEVFEIASQKTCVPKEILKGIAYIESGEFFSVVSPKYFLLYNSYNWWNSQFLTEEKRACGGYDFDNGSGLIEADSKFAGYNCHSDGSTGAQSYIFGPMQISGLEQQKQGPTAAKLLGVSKVDRRVILDAITIVGVITKINIKPTSCTNWSGHDIVKAACGYYGSCGIADGTYYCATFCRNYKRFGGKGSCDAASFGDDCWK